MFERLKGVYERYLMAHALVVAEGLGPLTLPDGTVFGYIESLTYSEQSLHIAGWSMLGGLELQTEDSRFALRRRIHRGDVLLAAPETARKLGVPGALFGFDAEVMWNGKVDAPVRLVIERDDQVLYFPMPTPGLTIRKRLHRAARKPFLKDLIGALPLLARFYLGGHDRTIQNRVRQRFGVIKPRSLGAHVDASFFAKPEAETPAVPPVTIVLPVYNAFELLQECVDRVLRHTHTPWHLVVVEDCSTDERVRPWLREWAARQGDRVTLLENAQNLGFIGGVNRGLAEAARRDEHVVLLNSDALVPDGWSSRLLYPLTTDDDVASVTPMSNDATIFSIPLIGAEQPLKTRCVDDIDAVARALSPELVADAPTGVGFCMAMNKAALKIEPQLDMAFGKGYGEEVDWCQKLRLAGMRHVGIGNLFVEHRGGQSFGSEKKAQQIAASGAIITERYPEFDTDVQRFFTQDPLAAPRLALAMAWLQAEHAGTVDLYFAHSMGGGAENWLSHRIDERREEGLASLVLRFGGQFRFRLELHLSGQTTVVEAETLDLIKRILSPLRRRRIVYSCAVGDSTPIEIPEFLLSLTLEDGEGLEILFHDYFPISPSYTLINSDRVYVGHPDPDSPDPVHHPMLPDGTIGTLAQWQQAWGRAIRRADRILTFSKDSAERVKATWPAAADHIEVRPHKLTFQIPVIDASGWKHSGPGVIGVLGGIGDVKGAKVVSDLSFWLHDKPHLPRLVVIGELDISYPRATSMTVTGRYHTSELVGLIEKHRITAWLMPSIWPETFSYTTHEMLATGLPVFTLDLGAQAEAARARPNGHVLRDGQPKTIVDAVTAVAAGREVA